MVTMPLEPGSPPFRAEHAHRAARFELPLPRDRAFELFTPEGERAWAEGWDPEYLHPVDGRAAAGMVFRTRAHGEETVWMMMRFDPGSGAVSYVRCTPGSRIATVDVTCNALGPHRCEVTVTYEFTGLSQAGNDWVRAMDEARYDAFIAEWKAAIGKALAAR
jgi:hypothetical protein